MKKFIIDIIDTMNLVFYIVKEIHTKIKDHKFLVWLVSLVGEIVELVIPMLI